MRSIPRTLLSNRKRTNISVAIRANDKAIVRHHANIESSPLAVINKGRFFKSNGARVLLENRKIVVACRIAKRYLTIRIGVSNKITV